MKELKLYLWVIGSILAFLVLSFFLGAICWDLINKENTYKLAEKEIFSPDQFELFMVGEGLRNGEIVHVKKLNFYGEKDSVKVRISTLPLIFASEAEKMQVLNLERGETLRLDANGNIWRQVEPGDTIRKMVDFIEPDEIYVVDALELKGNYNGQETSISRPVLRKIK